MTHRGVTHAKKTVLQIKEKENQLKNFKGPFSMLKYFSLSIKGQIKPKADWCTIDSPKKRTNEFVFPDCKAKKPNLFVPFLGESTPRQSAFCFI